MNPLNKTDQFIERARKIHGDFYDYSLTEFKNAKIKLKIRCPKHGVFSQYPNGHLQSSCRKCSYEKRSERISAIYDTDLFIRRSKEKHGDRYDYSLSEYSGYTTKIKIICKIHGSFLQTPGNHFNTGGCLECGLSKTGLYSNWYFDKNPELRDKKASLYLIKLNNLNEEFIKIGITINRIEDRISSFDEYRTSIIRVLPGALYELFLLEQSILGKYSKYRPNIRFGGHTECMDSRNIDSILSDMNLT